MSLVPVYVALDVFARGGPKISGLHDLLAIGLGGDGSDLVDLRASTRQRLYILDGLDEMGTAATVATIRSHLAVLRPLLESGARVLLSCRTHLFASESELDTALANAKSAGDLLAAIRENPAYAIAEIEELAKAEILGIPSKVLPSEDPEKTRLRLGKSWEPTTISATWLRGQSSSA